jgi:hypothetical protein
MTHVFSRFGSPLWASLLCVLNLGCATGGVAQPARLTTPDPTSIAKVRAVLATAMGRSQVELGPENMATSSSISVLPPPLGPLETRSLAVPKVFDIKVQNGACMLVARDDGKTYPLDGVKCSVIAPR